VSFQNQGSEEEQQLGDRCSMEPRIVPAQDLWGSGEGKLKDELFNWTLQQNVKSHSTEVHG
jgi:hypothetical protein